MILQACFCSVLLIPRDKTCKSQAETVTCWCKTQVCLGDMAGLGRAAMAGASGAVITPGLPALEACLAQLPEDEHASSTLDCAALVAGQHFDREC